MSTQHERAPAMIRKPLTEHEENYLQFLQARYARLDSDWAYAELAKFCRSLEKTGK
jgi:hypothetical protein